MAADWYEAEQDVHSWHRELDRLKRRARKRLFLTLFLTGLATAMILRMVARRVPLAESSILIRVTEGSVMWEDSPISATNLAQYLSDSAHSNRNLLHIMDKHGLYRLERMRGDAYALEEMREHLTLEVYRNYFLQARSESNFLRTARISLTFRDEDPVVSFAVASDLAHLIIDSEMKRREESSRGVAGVAQRALDGAVANLEKWETQLVTKETELIDARRKDRQEDVTAAQIDIIRLTEQVKEQRDVVQQVRTSKTLADLRHDLETGGVNRLYQIVDERAPPPPPEGKEIRLAIIGVAVFVILLPLCAVAVGAFDSRIHDPEDVQRLGLQVVGHVPGFAGFGIGSLSSRRAAERRRTRFRMT